VREHFPNHPLRTLADGALFPTAIRPTETIRLRTIDHRRHFQLRLFVLARARSDRRADREFRNARLAAALASQVYWPTGAEL
jgi:hypothetical protein